MKVFSVLLGALALVAGLAGGMRAYSASAGPTSGPVTVAKAPSYPPAQVVRPGVVVRWAPCKAPAVRQGRACVTRVVHTVVLPAPAPSTAPRSPAPQRRPAPAPSTTTAEPGDDGGHHQDGPGDHGGDDGGHHAGGDDGSHGGGDD